MEVGKGETKGRIGQLSAGNGDSNCVPDDAGSGEVNTTLNYVHPKPATEATCG